MSPQPLVSARSHSRDSRSRRLRLIRRSRDPADSLWRVAAATRTPTACSASTSPAASPWPRSLKTTSTPSPPNSTDALDEPSAGRHHHKHSSRRCDDRLNPPSMARRSPSTHFPPVIPVPYAGDGRRGPAARWVWRVHLDSHESWSRRGCGLTVPPSPHSHSSCTEVTRATRLEIPVSHRGSVDQ
jgi:hypothetical protein